MNKFLVLVLFLMSCIAAVAQVRRPTTPATKPAQTAPQTKPAEEQKGQPNPLAQHFYAKYQVASRWGDAEVAKNALYDLIVQFPGNDSIIFELAYFYFENQKYASSALICTDLIARNNRNAGALEVAGESYQALNIPDKALQNFESLYLLTSNPTVLYKMAFLQYQLKRYQECLTNIDILLAKPDAEKLKVVFNDAENKQKEYMMKVALLNLKGMTYRDQSDKVNAKKYFDEALVLAPDFLPAKQNLTGLK